MELINVILIAQFSFLSFFLGGAFFKILINNIYKQDLKLCENHYKNMIKLVNDCHEDDIKSLKKHYKEFILERYTDIEILKITKQNIKLIAQWVDIYECWIVVDGVALRPDRQTSSLTIHRDNSSGTERFISFVGECNYGDYLFMKNGKFKIIGNKYENPELFEVK